jgi:starch phosphorylase
VQLYHGALGVQGRIVEGAGVRMAPDDDVADGIHTYRCSVPCRRSGRRGFAVRVIPSHADLVHPFEPGRVCWG